MSDKNLQVLLARRPAGAVSEDDFRLVEADIPTPGEGEVLVRNHYLSLDPYMRMRMSDAKSYAKSVDVGEVMVGEAAGEVIASRDARFAVGDRVFGHTGWQLYGVVPGDRLHAAADARISLSAYLGAVGMPGITAYIGLLDFGQPKAGETVVVSAAAGAVGSVVGQLAKRHGCRAVGIAGGAEKCRYVVDELGFDACVDYKTPQWREHLEAATPDGVDVDFENVGGEILDVVLGRLNAFARIPLCGLVSQYNATDPYGVKNFRSLLTNRVRLQGFIVSDHLPRWPAARAALAEEVAQGRIKYRESVAEGLHGAPAAFIGMLAGRNLGKQLVKLF